MTDEDRRAHFITWGSGKAHIVVADIGHPLGKPYKTLCGSWVSDGHLDYSSSSGYAGQYCLRCGNIENHMKLTDVRRERGDAARRAERQESHKRERAWTDYIAAWKDPQLAALKTAGDALVRFGASACGVNSGEAVFMVDGCIVTVTVAPALSFDAWREKNNV